jgi:hypothetical protein
MGKQNINSGAGEAHSLSPAQAGVRADKYQGAVPRRHLASQPLDLRLG